jgi:signal recognition particle receptor subunit beta
MLAKTKATHRIVLIGMESSGKTTFFSKLTNQALGKINGMASKIIQRKKGIKPMAFLSNITRAEKSSQFFKRNF